MDILIVSKYIDSMPLAYRLKQDGHEVFLYIEDEGKGAENVGEGFVTLVDNWHDYTNSVDLVIFGDVYYGKEAEELRQQGVPVIGGNEYTDKLELDREFGQEEMEDAGYTILPSYEFSNMEEAKKFVEENPCRYVIKLDGEAGDQKELTYCGTEDDGSDVIRTLEHYETKFHGKIKKFILQLFVKGVEIGVGAYFDGNDFVNPVEINFEHKKLATGNLGPNTGEMGTSVLFVTTDHPLAQRALYPMRDKLKGYHGCFDINFMATKDALYPLEPTCRFGFPIIGLQLSAINGDMGERLLKIALGEDTSGDSINYEYGVILLGVVPPFPYEVEEISEKLSKDNLVLLKDPEATGIYPVECRQEDGQWYNSGGNGIPFLTFGMGDSMQDAKTLAYTRMANVSTPHLFYRIDISDRWSRDYPQLKEWGYL